VIVVAFSDHVGVTTVKDDPLVCTDMSRILTQISILLKRGVIHYASEGPPL
jgi:hypothetical protein